MTEFTMHTPETAPEGARDTLENVTKKFGFTPNILAIMAEAPATLNTYVTMQGLFEQATLSPAERQLAILTIARENVCDYCVPAHTLAARGAGLAEDAIAAVREGRDIPDAKLNALSEFARLVVVKRGRVSEDEVAALLDAGYPKAAIFEVILAAALKTITNHLNHVAHVPLDPAFESERWEAPAVAAE